MGSLPYCVDYHDASRIRISEYRVQLLRIQSVIPEILCYWTLVDTDNAVIECNEREGVAPNAAVMANGTVVTQEPEVKDMEANNLT